VVAVLQYNYMAPFFDGATSALLLVIRCCNSTVGTFVVVALAANKQSRFLTPAETRMDEEELKLEQDCSTFARLLAESPPPPPPLVRNTEKTFTTYTESTKRALPSSPAKSTTPKVRAKHLKKQKNEDAKKQGKFCSVVPRTLDRI
jgi:hypothetical protein